MLNDLKQFIDMAEKNRKYAPNTATGLRVALSVFESELNEQESESLQTFRDHLDSIYSAVFRKNQKDLSSNTILEYKRRVTRLINDYEQYGTDPNKLSAWVPVQRQSKPSTKKKTMVQESKNNEQKEVEKSIVISSSVMNRFELSLRPGIKAIILTPADLTVEEAKKIGKYIDYLESVSISN